MYVCIVGVLCRAHSAQEGTVVEVKYFVDTFYI
jgi:hypothetical protein